MLEKSPKLEMSRTKTNNEHVMLVGCGLNDESSSIDSKNVLKANLKPVIKIGFKIMLVEDILPIKSIIKNEPKCL